MRKVFAFMLAIVLALLCACAAAEEAAEDLSLEYLRRGDGIYRLGNTGYLVEDSRSFVTEETMAGLERTRTPWRPSAARRRPRCSRRSQSR